MDNNRNWAGWAALGLAALALLVALSGRGGDTRNRIAYAYPDAQWRPGMVVPAAPQAPVAPAMPAVPVVPVAPAAPVMPMAPMMPMSPKMMPPAGWQQWQGHRPRTSARPGWRGGSSTSP